MVVIRPFGRSNLMASRVNQNLVFYFVAETFKAHLSIVSRRFLNILYKDARVSSSWRSLTRSTSYVVRVVQVYNYHSLVIGKFKTGATISQKISTKVRVGLNQSELGWTQRSRAHNFRQKKVCSVKWTGKILGYKILGSWRKPGINGKFSLLPFAKSAYSLTSIPN